MKRTIYKIFYTLSILLVVAFLVFVIIDAVSYNSMFTSAPFYVFILIRAIEFLLPAILLFIIAVVIRKSYKKGLSKS